MEAPKIPSFIKTKYNFKRFSFQPRFYDPEKERLEVRKKAIQSELKDKGEFESADIAERKARMKMIMNENWRNRRGREYRKSNLRIAFIVAILVIALYVVKQKMGL
jgi:hypothetical protein